jgi:hypothetical protein
VSRAPLCSEREELPAPLVQRRGGWRARRPASASPCCLRRSMAHSFAMFVASSRGLHRCRLVGGLSCAALALGHWHFGLRIPTRERALRKSAGSRSLSHPCVCVCVCCVVHSTHYCFSRRCHTDTAAVDRHERAKVAKFSFARSGARHDPACGRHASAFDSCTAIPPLLAMCRG